MINKIFISIFSIFSFVMFSCVFPTGFSATLSVFSFFSGLLVCFSNKDKFEFNLNYVTTASFLIFTYIVLTLGWSYQGSEKSIVFISEYRIFFMVPVIAAALTCCGEQYLRFPVYAALCGLLIALISSYLLVYGAIEVEGAIRSLANRIFHGFIMAIFLLGCLCMVVTQKKGRIAYLVLALVIAYNILGIENGRTGFLLLFAVVGVVAWYSLPAAKRYFAPLLIVLVSTGAFLSIPEFNMRVVETFQNIEKMLVFDNYNSSAGYRLELYINALRLIDGDWVFGAGVANVVDSLQKGYEAGIIRMSIDNPHSEMLNMFLIGGLVGVILYLTFIFSIFMVGFNFIKFSNACGLFIIGMSVIIFVASLFNSIIKDYGEKHILIIVLSIICGFVDLKMRRRPILLSWTGVKGDRRNDA